jgi:hypothetical protein
MFERGDTTVRLYYALYMSLGRSTLKSRYSKQFKVLQRAVGGLHGVQPNFPGQPTTSFCAEDVMVVTVVLFAKYPYYCQFKMPQDVLRQQRGFVLMTKNRLNYKYQFLREEASIRQRDRHVLSQSSHQVYGQPSPDELRPWATAPATASA